MSSRAALRRRRPPDLLSAAAAVRDLDTPEGVPLHITIGRAGDRAVAFLLDSALMFVGMLVVAAASEDATGGDETALIGAFTTLALFLLQNFYFIFFEARERGATPGKRLVGVRVIDASGGTLTVKAVVVRNLMRNLEFYFPLVAILAPEAFWPGMPGWARLLSAAWMFVLFLLPLFNRDRLRVGDLVAGTMVVTEPKAVLLADLGRKRSHRFTESQLDVYGEYELQVLEDVLRKGTRSTDGMQTMAAVADQIARKIGYADSIARADRRPFLMEFYAALRARLEQRRLFGRRKADKFEAD